MPVCPNCATKLEGEFIQCPSCEHPINKKAFFLGHTLVTLFLVVGFSLLVSFVYYFTSQEGRRLAMGLYALRMFATAEEEHKSRYGTYTLRLEELEKLRPVKNFLPLFSENKVSITVNRSSFEISGKIKQSNYLCRMGKRNEKPYHHCVKIAAPL